MTVSDGKRAGVALVIGISQYLHDGIASLDLAVADARAVARILTDPDVCNFPADNVLLLSDEEAGRDALVESLSVWLPEKGRAQDIVLLYYAGHGTVKQIGTRDEGYLLPFDANPERPATRGIPMNDVSRWIEAVEAKSVILCLDCCHAAKVISRADQAPSVPRALGLRPSALPDLKGGSQFLLASCAENQYSLESPQLGHGLFTYYLLRGLKGEADENRDGKVGVAELFEYVAREVGNESIQKMGLPQTPWYKASNAGGVYLAEPRRRHEAGLKLELEDLWDEDRGEALRRIEQLVPAADEESLRPVLRMLRARPDPLALPVLFRLLSLPIEGVQQRARLAIDAIGWSSTVRFIEEQVRLVDKELLGVVLDGLATFEANPELVNLLENLTFLLRDHLRVRAQHLLGRKRLGLELEKTRELFRQHHSPYELLRVLGQGTLAAAYLARHRMTELEAVVRVLRPQLAGEPAVRAQFLDLARRSIRMVHQSLVRILDVQALPEHQIFYMIRDHVNGVTLQKLTASGKRFEPPQVLHILKQLASALTPWHKDHCAHLGVKPSNIFVCEENRVVLGDSSLPVRDLLGKGEIERTAYDARYAAPETFRSSATIGPPADLYALGCVIYELLCGVPPFESEELFELAQQHANVLPSSLTEKGNAIKDTVDAVVMKLLNKLPEQRFASAEAVLDTLEYFRQQRHPDRSASPPVPPTSQTPIVPDLSGSDPPTLSETLHPEAGGALLDQASLQRYQSMISMPALDPAQVTRHGSLPGTRAELNIPGYEILEVLGRGGMGVVYKARQLALQRLVALKMILYHDHRGSEELRRFQTEAEAIARIQHPNIVTIYEVGEVNGVPYISLEYLAGGSLARRLDKGPLKPRETAELVIVLAQAIQAAHDRGIVHRDLKPANVLFKDNGSPKIVDFGLAKQQERVGETASGAVVGTPSYMAPEQATGQMKDIGPSTDVYSLGGILYECLTGRPPFRAQTVLDTLSQVLHQEVTEPRQLNPGVPRDLDTICLKCLQKDPSRRYASAGELANDLSRFLAGEPIHARPGTRLERLFKFIRRRPAVALLVLLVLTLAISAVVIASLLARL